MTLPPESNPSMQARAFSTKTLFLAIILSTILSACSGSSSSSGTHRQVSDSGSIAAGFRASSVLVEPGSTVTLSWNLSAQSCNASGAWNGEKPNTGTEQVGPISARSTYTLSCMSGSGTVLEMVDIRVNGSVSFSWVPPTQNADGSELNDLAGYRIYAGERSREYDQTIDLGDPMATEARITLPSGEYHLAMTALDQEGNESAYSNEILRSTP